MSIEVAGRHYRRRRFMGSRYRGQYHGQSRLPSVVGTGKVTNTQALVEQTSRT
jgi:hypothetical protein